MVYTPDSGFSPIRVTGVDPPSEPQVTDQPEQIVAVQPQNFNEGIASNINQAAETQKQTSKDVTTAQVAGISSSIDALSAGRKLQQTIMAAVPSETLLGKNLQGMQQGLLRTEQIRQMELQRVDAQKQGYQKERKAQATLDFNQLGVQVQDLVDASPETGMQQAQKLIMDTFGKYPDLAPDDVTELANKAWGNLRDIQQHQSDRTYNELKQIQNTETDKSKAELSLRASGILVGLGQAQTSEEREGLFKQFFQVADEVATRYNLNPAQKSQLQLFALESAAKDTTLGVKAQAEINRHIDQTRAYYTDAQNLQYRSELDDKDPNFISPAQLKEGLAELRVKYQMPDSASPVTTLEMRKQLLDNLNTNQGIQKAIETDQIDERNAQGVISWNVGQLVWAEINGKGQGIGHWKRLAAQGDDTASSVVYWFDHYRQNRSQRDALLKERSTLESNLASETDALGRVDEKGIARGSQAKVDAINARMAEIDRQVIGKDNDLAPIFLDRGQQSLDAARGKYEPLIKQLRDQAEAKGYQPNFSPGGGASQAPQPTKKLVQLKTYNGAILPLLASEPNPTITSGYGMRTHPITGKPSFHEGIDVSVPVGTKIVSPWSGTVVKIDDAGNMGYGKFMTIRLGTGQYVRLGHLSAFKVKEGQKINQGQLVALSGQSGDTTGPHLHYEIRNDANFGKDGSLDPIVQMGLLNQRYYKKPQAIGPVSSNPSNVARPPGDSTYLGLGNGVYISNNRMYLPGGSSLPVTRTASVAQPLGATTASSRATPQDDLNANHGYKQLAKDPQFARALNMAARELGIPGAWLADVIDYETIHTFSGSIRGGATDPKTGRGGYVGLIQFGVGTARGLGTNQTALQSMGRVNQLKYVVRYLKERPGPLKTMRDLYAKINIGNSLPSSIRRNPPDGNGRFLDHIHRIGRTVGRKYANVDRDTRLAAVAQTTHTSYNDNCAVCQGLIASGSEIIPHRAELTG